MSCLLKIICAVPYDKHTPQSMHCKTPYIHLLYVAWPDQRHRQCCIRHTEQFLNRTVLYDGRQGEGGRTFFTKVW